MKTDKQSVFLEQRTYRKRRMADAARMVPLLGAMLFGVPLLWASSTDHSTTTTYVMIYLFLVWVGMIGVAAWVSSRLSQGEEDLGASKDE